MRTAPDLNVEQALRTRPRHPRANRPLSPRSRGPQKPCPSQFPITARSSERCLQPSETRPSRNRPSSLEPADLTVCKHCGNGASQSSSGELRQPHLPHPLSLTEACSSHEHLSREFLRLQPVLGVSWAQTPKCASD